jgi:flavodoxin I
MSRVSMAVMVVSLVCVTGSSPSERIADRASRPLPERPNGTRRGRSWAATTERSMDILVVFGSQYGNTQRIARAVANALMSEHDVRVLPAAAATDIPGDDVDLLFVGAPTQMRGLRLLTRPFLDGLAERGFRGTPAAAFDTRMDVGPQLLASTVIADQLAGSGCRLVAEPESFLVLGLEGPLADGEEARAGKWARTIVGALAGSA